jgi:hypothetical protein
MPLATQSKKVIGTEKMVGDTGLEPVTPTVGILKNVHKLVKELGRIGNHFQSFLSR